MGFPWPGACVDGVKVDCQSTIDMIGNTLGGGSALSRAYHAALEESVAQHFPGNACINCMCHSTNDLYRCASIQPCFRQASHCPVSSWYLGRFAEEIFSILDCPLCLQVNLLRVLCA